MAEKLLLLFVVVAATLLALARADPVVCDFDPEAECPEGNSCCPSDITSCCPLPQATCCVDNQHCCPQGTQCLPGGNCQYVDHTVVPATRLGLHNGNGNGFKKSNTTKTAPAPAATEEENNNNKYKKLEKSLVSALLNATNSNHECPDQRSQCSDSNTCCLLSHGGYGCCALPNAVCCSDNIHCCPAGYFCLSGGTCGDSPALAAASVVTASRKQTKALRIGRPQRRRPQQPQQSQQQEKLSKVVCPNGQACPDGATCCPAPSGGYGCCGLPNAVCCSDRIHCCPYGTTCDGDNCVTNDASVSSRKRFHAKMFWQP